MLTEEEIEVLRQIRGGQAHPANSHTTSLIDKGYLSKSGESFEITEHGHGELRLLPGFGEALVDILIPGAGSNEAMRATHEDRDTEK